MICFILLNIYLYYYLLFEEYLMIKVRANINQLYQSWRSYINQSDHIGNSLLDKQAYVTDALFPYGVYCMYFYLFVSMIIYL